MTLFLYSVERAFDDDQVTLDQVRRSITHHCSQEFSCEQFVLEICRTIRAQPHLIKDFSQSGLISDDCHIEWSGYGIDQRPNAVAIHNGSTSCSVHRLDPDSETHLKIWNSTDLRQAITQLKVCNSEELRRAICEPNELGKMELKNLSSSDATSFMVIVQFALDTQPWSVEHRRLCHSVIKRLLRVHNILPPSFQIEDLTSDSAHPVDCGGYADIYLGSLRGQPVCMKVLRMYNNNSDRQKEVIRAFCSEAFIWRQLKHPNILPFLGVNEEKFPGRFCLISPYLSNGNVNSYLHSHPGHDKVQCIREIAIGMEYLHSLDICHGDIRGANILMGDDFRCRLADFGITGVVESQTATSDLSDHDNIHGALRWMAPEVLMGQLSLSPTRDVYAFACTVVEVASGNVPFSEFNSDPAVLCQVVQRGARPSRPQDQCITDDIWELLNRCWVSAPQNRLKSSMIVSYLTENMHRYPSMPSSSISPSTMRSLPSLPDAAQNGFESQIHGSTDDISPISEPERLPPYTLEPSFTSNRVLVLVTTDWENYMNIDISGATDGHAVRQIILSKVRIYDEAERAGCSVFRTNFVGIMIGNALTESQLYQICATEGDGKGTLKFAILRPAPRVHGSSFSIPRPTLATGRASPMSPSGSHTPAMSPTPTNGRSPRPLPTVPTPTDISPHNRHPDSMSHNCSTSSKGLTTPTTFLVDATQASPQLKRLLRGKRDNPGESVTGSSLSPISTRSARQTENWKIKETTPTIPSQHTIKHAKSVGSLLHAGGRIIPLAVGKQLPPSPKVEMPPPPGHLSHRKPSISLLPDRAYTSPTTSRTPRLVPSTIVSTGRSLPPSTRPTINSSLTISPRQSLRIRTDFDNGAIHGTTLNLPSTPPSKLLQHERDQSRSRPTNSQGKDKWAPRPRLEAVCEDMEKYFPGYDVDSRIVEGSSSTSSPIDGDHRTPTAPSAQASLPIAHDNPSKRRSLRMVAQKNILEDQQSRSAGPSRHSGRRMTKLWGLDAEEVKREDLRGKRKSIPKSVFKCSWLRGELLGRGAYASVYLAMNASTGEMMAVKEVETPNTVDSTSVVQIEVVKALKREIMTLKGLDHPNIVQYLGYQETPRNLTIFLEYVPGGSISSCLRKYGKFEENITKSFLSQILGGLEYLHSRNVIHRDLKADNILCEEGGVCKISDFGVSKKTKSDTRTMQGSVYWMAPEIVRDKDYHSKVDIWSVGCVALEMWSGERPWVGHHSQGVLLQIYTHNILPPLPNGTNLTSVAEEFRQKCFSFDPNERPDAATLRTHRYLDLSPSWSFQGFG